MHAHSISRRLALLAVASALAVSAAPAAAADKDDFLIVPGTRFGPIGKNTTLADLERIYGKERVRVRMEQPPHGDFPRQRAAVIFSGTPDEAVAYLADDGKTVERVVIQNPGGRWRSREGLRIGADVAALEKMLGGPFPISAFGQDGGGAVRESRKTAVARHLFIRLSPDRKRRISAADEAAMNRDFRSSHPAARRARLAVSAIWWDIAR
jgi:hypothetical protein